MPQHSISDSGAACPLCGGDNRCGVRAGLSPSSCWCTAEIFPPEIFDLIPPGQRGKACICKSCLDNFKKTGEVRGTT